ncbi:MAG: DUF58 domain-containing protein [Acidobacteriota bacterium]|jgi:uncharacterized protein (DUF58 family)
MMVPRTRLLFWFAAVVIPAAALAGLFPSTAGYAGIVIALFAVSVLGDAAAGLRRREDYSLVFPDSARFFHLREDRLGLKVAYTGAAAKVLKLGLGLPSAFTVPEPVMEVLLAAGEGKQAVEWLVRPCERGRFIWESLRLETVSPLGFWALWRTHRPGTELKVYPDIIKENRQALALMMNRGSAGIHLHRQVGKGREFERLRDYVPGDSYDDIHWKVAAKRGRPVTKVFQIEKTQEIYVVLDQSRLSGRTIPGPSENSGARNGETLLEGAIKAALVLALAAGRQGDRFGLISCDDKVESFLPAKAGREQFNACRDVLYALAPREVSPDFGEVFAFIRSRLRHRALFVFLTSLDDPLIAEEFARHAALVSRQHLVLVNMFRPPGARPLFHNPDLKDIPGIYRELAGHIAWNDLALLRGELKQRGVALAFLESERACVQLVSQYLNVKRRQIL